MRGTNMAEAGHATAKEPKGRKASSITIGRSYSLSLVGVLVRVYKLVSSPALPQQTLVAFDYTPQPAATGGLFYGRRYYWAARIRRVSACHGALLDLLHPVCAEEAQIRKVVRRIRL